MRSLNRLNHWRLTTAEIIERYGSAGNDSEGAFIIPSPVDGADLRVIASSGAGWDHVSVSRRNRAPNQRELAYIFQTFFADGETAVQYFVPAAEHVNCHPYCLHLFRPQAAVLPKPPRSLIG